MPSLAEVYDEHGLGTLRDFVAVTINGLREHIDRITEICKTVHDLRPRTVLDAPCATGLITALVSYYIDGPKKVVGLDISESYCLMAREIYGIETVCMDLFNYKPEEKFDLVMCLELLEHVPNPDLYVKQVLTFTKKWALFSVPFEAQPVDGEIHVRKVHPTELWDWITNAGARVERMWVLPSVFCEKPKWLGWVFALAEVA